MTDLTNELNEIIRSATQKLKKIPPSDAKIKPAPQKWSKQEILGHLIDSASNNHQRFVRAQLLKELSIEGYEQDDWVMIQKYNESNWEELIYLWQFYNLHILHILKNIPFEKLKTPIIIGTNEPVSLEFIISDYLRHLKHHLKQILD